MEKETVSHHNFEQFLDGYALTGASDLDLLEREDNEIPEQVSRDNRRLWTAGIVTAVAGTGLAVVSNLGLFAEAWPFLLGAGIVGAALGGARLLGRIFRKKTLNLPMLEIRRKTEQVKQNAMNAFAGNSRRGGLSRSNSDKVFMGVCGGLAAQTGISATLIRAVFIAAFAVTSGLAALLYIAIGVMLPEEKAELPK